MKKEARKGVMGKRGEATEWMSLGHRKGKRRGTKTCEICGGLRDALQVHVGRQAHAARALEHNIIPPVCIRQRHVHEVVEAPRAQESRINHVQPVGGTDQYHTPCRLDPVEFIEERRQHALLHAAGFRAVAAAIQ